MDLYGASGSGAKILFGYDCGMVNRAFFECHKFSTAETQGREGGAEAFLFFAKDNHKEKPLRFLCASAPPAVEMREGLFFRNAPHSNSILWKLISNSAFSSGKYFGFEPSFVFLYF